MNEFWKDNVYLLYIFVVGSFVYVKWSFGEIVKGYQKFQEKTLEEFTKLWEKYDCISKDLAKLQGAHDERHCSVRYGRRQTDINEEQL